MTSLEAESWAALGSLVGRLIAEVQSLRDGLTTKQAALNVALEALAGKDAEAERKVQAALDADSDADVVRITGLVNEISAALPVEVPTVPVPPIGQPAQDPDVNPEPAPQPGTEGTPPTEG